jgi:peptidoglycan/xylan/chitin deacetylase (PgdA/CDA1 family)
MQVCITIDTEFSVAGAFTSPHTSKPVAEPLVNCEANGSEQGLGFLLNTFADFGIKATFFVEALNYCYFGDGPMKAIASRILASGHDVQLHVHPCWTYFRDPGWINRLNTTRPNDSFIGRPTEEIAEFLELGLSAFARWELPRPVAFRTGSLQADSAIYQAGREVDLKISSSVGLGGPFTPSEPELRISGGRRRIKGVLELPVLSYRELTIGPVHRHHLLTVTGTNFREAAHLLRAARAAGISPVVLLTHPFEYAKSSDPAYVHLVANQVNQRRLRKLCEFLCSHSDDFVAVTFAEGAPGWLADEDLDVPTLKAPFRASVGRMIENKLNDWIWNY